MEVPLGSKAGGMPEKGMVLEKSRAARRSVVAGFALALLKLIAGLTTGSLGLVAEAIHSGLDCVAAVVTWFAVRTSWRPPDAEHHYGHGKIENLAALGETILLAMTSVWIIYEAINRLLGAGPEVEPGVWAFIVIGIAIVVDVVRARDLSRVARKSGSQALEADALHFSTDVASSTVVLIGLACVLAARRFNVPWLEAADSIAAILVAIIVLVLGWRLGRRSVDVLLDRAPAGSRAAILAALSGMEEMAGQPGVNVRQAGDRIFADVELFLKPGIPVVVGERIAERAREETKALLGEKSSVLVQLRALRETAASLRDRLATAVSMEGLHAHNITIRSDRGSYHADFHLELAGELSLDAGHEIADRVEETIIREVPELKRVDIHLDIHDEEPDRAVPVDEDSRVWLEGRIHEIVRETGAPCTVHDILLVRTEAGLYLSCHCTLPGNTSLREAHSVADDLEHALYSALPGLDRVAVHAEPR